MRRQCHGAKVVVNTAYADIQPIVERNLIVNPATIAFILPGFGNELYNKLNAEQRFYNSSIGHSTKGGRKDFFSE